MVVERETIVLRKLKKIARSGWAEAARRLADDGDDVLVWPELPNEDDASLKW
jgi:antitoxin MazE